MKRNFYTMVAAAMLACTTGAVAQTDPGTTNLAHQWTFEDGTANDAVSTNPVNGTVVGGTIVDGAYVNSTLTGNAAAYIDFSASALALNTYTAVTFESWAACSSASTNNAMLAYFGGQNGGNGVNHCFMTTSASRAAISCLNTANPWTTETSIAGTSLNAGTTLLHHQVYVLTATDAYYYIDGVLQGTAVLSADNKIANLATTYAWLGRSGYTGDPAWQGKIAKFSIYNKALSADEILFLFQKGADSKPSLAATVTALGYDELYTSDVFKVTGMNLSNSISIEYPAGLTVSPSSLASNAANADVSVTWDGATVVNGYITLTSGSMIVKIPVHASANTSCYTPAYSTGNLIADPTFSKATLAAGGFGGWGPTAITTTKAYCGRGSAYIRGTCWPDGGSLDRGLTTANGNALKPATNYVLRAMVNSQASSGTFFQFQIEGYDGTASKFFNIENTNGWKQLEFTFTTGATVTQKGIYFNSCGDLKPLITDTCFIDNYELFAVPLATGVDELAQQLNKVYAAGNTVVAEFDLAKASDVKVSVYDLQGKLMAENFNQYGAGFNKVVVNASLPNGLYIVKVVSDEFAISTKLIK